MFSWISHSCAGFCGFRFLVLWISWISIINRTVIKCSIQLSDVNNKVIIEYHRPNITN